MLNYIPSVFHEKIKADRSTFLAMVSEVLASPEDLIILVDKKNALPADYEPSDLVQLETYGLSVSRKGLMLRKSIMDAVMEMNKAALEEGIVLVFSSAYRSYKYQAEVYERNVKAYGREAADRESAMPGKSQHQLGTTADFGSISDDFAYTKAGRWLKANAWKYGFSMSYPENMEAVTGYRYESWHFRYIGKEAALLEKEFFGSVQQYMLEFFNKAGSYLRTRLR
jgi:D-alanyl-D-alanine carboxypeptidase